MHWYYADGNKQVGPFDDGAFEQLIQNGTVKPDTLVWREGMAQWQPLSAVRGGSPAAPPVQPAAAPPPATVADLSRRDYSVDIGGSISRAWALLKDNFWLLVGATFLVYVVSIGAGMLPYVGWLLQLVLQGPLIGGLYVLYLKLIRGEEGTLGDGFSGFGPRFVQLMCAHVVSSILLGLCFLPSIIIGFTFLVKVIAEGNPQNMEAALEELQPVMVPLIACFALAVLAAIYLGTCWVFMLPLVADKGLNFWSALVLSMKTVNRHWFAVFGLMVVCGFVVMLGVLGCCIGVFVTLPILLGALMYTYEDIFGNAA